MIHKETDIGNDSYSALVNELKKKGFKYSHTLDLLQYDWPASEKILRNLASHLSFGFADDDGFVLVRIVTEALNAYEGALRKKNEDDNVTDHERMCVFLEILISATCHCMQIKAVDDRTGDSWTIDSKESFGQWVESRKGNFIIVEDGFNDERGTRAKLYEKVVTENLRNLFRTYQYEDSIVDGHLVAGS